MRSSKDQSMQWLSVMKDLEEAVWAAHPEALPVVLGEVERLKALLWTRLAFAPRRHPTTPEDPEVFLTIPQVAERLALPKGRVYELARQGQLPVVRLGKYVRVP